MSAPTPRNRRGSQREDLTTKQQGVVILVGVYVAALVALVAVIVVFA